MGPLANNCGSSPFPDNSAASSSPMMAPSALDPMAASFTSLTTGNSRREITLGTGAFGGMTLAADGTLYCAGNTPDGHQHLFALNFVTGETNWVFSPTNYGISGLNIGADGTLFFQYYSYGGGLTAVHGSSPLANTAWPKGLQNPQSTSLWRLSGPPIITRQPLSHWAALNASAAFHFHSPVM